MLFLINSYILKSSCCISIVLGVSYYARCPEGHTVSKNGSISLFCFNAGWPERHTVSKNGSISFLFYAGCHEGAYRV